ncbi:MAG: transcription antitermination factor NusB [Chitinophagaceae bacterium]|jgi:N utilization substance protein B|nr:transcription antitermination factor NusB [Chitinophagaceae bacterium]
MISRRNIRVKVMQLLYIIETSGDTKLFKDPVIELQKKLDRTRELFVYLLYCITEVARYAETDARNRAAKNLPNFDDLNVNTKIAGNLLLWQILENESYKKALETDKPQHLVDKDLIRKLYQQLAETTEYKTYINEQSRDKKTDKDILEFIFNSLLLPNANFEEQIEEHFNNWDDDGEMMQQLINNFLQKPTQNIQQMTTPEKWTFAKNLLTSMIDKKDYALELIKPKLKNWDSDRIALLDMLIMQMGVCELLYFETIPTKVTINEYIDLAKDYSTPQSGQFVNGILDNLHKELLAQGKINKVDFKKRTH